MPYPIDPNSYNALAAQNYGIHLVRPSEALPQSATKHLFQITGGRVFLRFVMGEVTTIVQAQATTFKFTSTPTTGSAVDLCATADLNGKEVGAKFGPIGTLATAMNLSNAGALQGLNVEPTILAIGYIDGITVASSTGAVKYDAWWMPFDDGAALVLV